MDPHRKLILGQDRDLIGFDTADEARELALCMVAQGERSALLFTRQLDPLLYDKLAFADALSQLLRVQPHSFCHILVQDTENLASRDHRLITVAQKLPSYCSIRLVPEEARDEMRSFLVVDGQAYLFRPNGADYEGAACFNDPGEARHLSHWFEPLWQHGSPMAELRRLGI